jgi:MraZ protein
VKYFSGNATNKVDAKGRVSIPAPFRKVLGIEESPLLFLMPDVRGKPAIEGYGQSQFERLAEAADQLSPVGEDFDGLADLVFSQTQQLPLDSTGRIVLPPEFREFARIEGEALFVGRVKAFQIWAPEAYRQHAATLREGAKANLNKLPWGRPMGGSS